MPVITKSFEAEEKQKALLTTPNILSASRAVGGFVLGVMMMRRGIDAKTAFIAGTALLATDAEGTLINATRRFPKVQNALKIWPSKVGRLTDPIADKMFVTPVILGGVIGGYMPPSALSVVATELATTGSTFYAGHKIGEAPKVSWVGKVGMIARSMALGAYMGSSAVQSDLLADSLNTVGHVSTIAAVGLGTASMIDIYRQTRQPRVMLEPQE